MNIADSIDAIPTRLYPMHRRAAERHAALAAHLIHRDAFDDAADAVCDVAAIVTEIVGVDLQADPSGD